MPSSLERFKKQLEDLTLRGHQLQMSMRRDCNREALEQAIKTQLKGKADEYLKKLPKFEKTYQRWYTEAHAVIRQLVPDRLPDFVRLYEKPKGRKEIDYESYRIEDYLQGLEVTRAGHGVIVNKSAAIPQFDQQVAILEAANARFESSLLDMRQVLQADLFDTELEAAEHLAKFKFFRASGALAGVVLERHLCQVCDARKVTVSKTRPTIADFNEALKAADAIDLPQWRFVQHLADLRNLCDHARKTEPTHEQIIDLLAGVSKVIKTIL